MIAKYILCLVERNPTLLKTSTTSTLQRLDVYHRNNGGYVFYDAKHFAPTADRWNAVPVIYVETGPGEPQNIPGSRT